MTRPRCLLTLPLMLAALMMPVGASAQETPGDADVEIATAPIEIDGAVLFRVRGVPSLPADVRARGIRERLTAIARDSSIAVESLRLVDADGVTRIIAGDTTVMGLVDADADLEQIERNQLAAVHLRRIGETLRAYRDARSPESLRRHGINALVATIVLALAIVGAFRLHRGIDAQLTRRLQTRIHTVGIQSFELMRAERIWRVLRSAVGALRTIAVVVVVFLYLGFVLAQFPLTRGVSRDMVAFTLAPLQVLGAGLVSHIPGLIFLAVLFLVVRVGLRLIRLFFDAVANRTVTLETFDPEWAQPTYKIVRLVVVAFALIVAYPYIPGSQSAAFRGVSLFIGIVFSLGSSSAISNIIAGYMMTYRRAFKVGDRIKVGETMGDVIEMRLQVTHLRSAKNEEIIIPNSQILAGEVRNFSSLARVHGLILHSEVGIGYETPWRQVEAMLVEAADRTSGLEREPRPFVLEKALGDFAITYELNVYCNDVRGMFRLYAELHRQILDVFNEYGVQIMTPAYEGDPDVPKVVPPAAWYPAPAAPKRSVAAR